MSPKVDAAFSLLESLLTLNPTGLFESISKTFELMTQTKQSQAVETQTVLEPCLWQESTVIANLSCAGADHNLLTYSPSPNQQQFLLGSSSAKEELLRVLLR